MCHRRVRGGYVSQIPQVSNNIHRHLVYVRQARFPLLLHFLEQHKDTVELGQWQDWLLALATDTIHQVDSDQWTGELVTALVEQLSMYSSDSTEKSFCVVLTGQVLTKVNNKQPVIDMLVSRHPKAFGICASAHLWPSWRYC